MRGKALVLLISVMIFGSIITTAQATETIQPQQTAQMQSGEITPHADVIVDKYRYINGYLQIRQWNETRGYWIGEWVTIGWPAD